jgi:hypothetical protein
LPWRASLKGLAVAAIFAVAGGYLNARDFISRGVEGATKTTSNQLVAEIIGWKSEATEISPQRQSSSFFGKNTC